MAKIYPDIKKKSAKAEAKKEAEAKKT